MYSIEYTKICYYMFTFQDLMTMSSFYKFSSVSRNKLYGYERSLLLLCLSCHILLSEICISQMVVDLKNGDCFELITAVCCAI